MDERTLQNVKEEAREYLLTQGILINGKPAPVSLLPTLFPRRLFNLYSLALSPMKSFNVMLTNNCSALELMPIFNAMTHKVAADVQFLEASLSPLDDDFTQRLLHVLREVTRRGISQDKVLGIFRSDYMLHDGGGDAWRLQQVEMNRISCAFPGLSTLVSQCHRYLLQRFPHQQRPDWTNTFDNRALDGVVDSLHHAWQLFGDASAVVMMVVQEGEKNATDQRHIELTLWNKHKVPLIRRSLQALGARALVDDKKNLRMYALFFVFVFLSSIDFSALVMATSLQWRILEQAIVLKITLLRMNGLRDLISR